MSNYQRLPLMAIFALFVFLRIFSGSEYYFIQGGDAARYLELAKNFPHHTLDNNQLHVLHPPLYPYAIHFFSFIFEDHAAAIAVSLFASILTFFILYRLVLLLSNNIYITYFTLILFSLSQIYIDVAANVLKEPLAVMLALGAIYFYLEFLVHNKKNHIYYSSIFSFFLGITTDHAVLLIPSLIAAYLLFKNSKKSLKAFLPLASVIISYGFWILIKAYVYSTNDFYPASLDGTIVSTSGWGLKQLLSSQYFPEMKELIPFGLSFEPLHYIYPMLYI